MTIAVAVKLFAVLLLFCFHPLGVVRDECYCIAGKSQMRIRLCMYILVGQLPSSLNATATATVELPGNSALSIRPQEKVAAEKRTAGLLMVQFSSIQSLFLLASSQSLYCRN